MDTYRITRPGQQPEIVELTEKQAHAELVGGAKVDLAFFGQWFPVRLGSVAL